MAPPARAALPIDDWACRYGWGVFETIRLFRGRPLFLARHLRRLQRAGQFLWLTRSDSNDSDQWRRDIEKALRRAQISEAVVNLYWSRGIPPEPEGRRIVCVRPFPRHPRRPLRLWPAPWRIDPTSPGTGAKTLAYFPYVFASLCARQEGCDEAIILNSQGRVADGAHSTIFAIVDDRLLTPSLREGALPGITRALILESAAKLGIFAGEGRLTWKRLMAAECVFVTSSLRGIARVSELHGRRRFRRIDHPLLSRLKAAYRVLIKQEIKTLH